MDYQTLKSLRDNIDVLIKKHPQWENLPIIYSVDDEENVHHRIHQEIAAIQVHDINEYYLEIVGYLGDEGISKKDINCVIIN